MSSYLLTHPAEEGLSTLHHLTDSWVKYGSRPGLKNTATSFFIQLFLCIVIYVQYKICTNYCYSLLIVASAQKVWSFLIITWGLDLHLGVLHIQLSLLLLFISTLNQ